MLGDGLRQIKSEIRDKEDDCKAPWSGASLSFENCLVGKIYFWNNPKILCDKHWLIFIYLVNVFILASTALCLKHILVKAVPISLVAPVKQKCNQFKIQIISA